MFLFWVLPYGNFCQHVLRKQLHRSLFWTFCKTDSIWSLVNLCTNHCQVPLATFLECKESFPSLPFSSFLLFSPSPWYIINASTQITLLGITAFLTFSYKQSVPKSQGCDTGLWLQGTTLCLWFSLLWPGSWPAWGDLGSTPALLLLQPVTHLCVTSWSRAEAMAASFWLLDKYKILIFTQNAALDYLDPVLHLPSLTLWAKSTSVGAAQL